MINTVFHPEAFHEYSGRYFNDYRISISSDPDLEGVQLNAMDADDSLTIVEFGPDRARDIANALNAAADDVESRLPRRVGDTGLTTEQLESLPIGSVVQFDGTRHAIRVDGAYHSWITDSGTEWLSLTLSDRERQGDNKLLFIAEVKA